MSLRIGRLDEPPVVVLGVGVTALGALRILGRDRLRPLVAERTDPLLRSSRWYRALPAGVPPIAGRTLADWLPTLPVDRAVLLPCSDHRVSEVAALSPELRERFPASVPTAETLRRFVDKALFAEMLLAADVPHPFSKAISETGDLEDVPDAIFSSAMLKPRDSQSFVGHFGTKALHVSSRRDAGERLAQVRAAGFGVILQEYVPGPATEHYFVDGFIDRDGIVRAVFARQRLRMYPLDFGNSTAMVSVEPRDAGPAVEAITTLLKRVNYRGIFSAEFKRDPRDGVFKILEVNTRAWWYVDFAARCGVNVCRMAYQDALERSVGTVERYDVGRVLVFPYYDYFACQSLRKAGKLTALGWIRSWSGAMQPVFQFRDPSPGIRAFVKIISGFIRNRIARMLSVGRRSAARTP